MINAYQSLIKILKKKSLYRTLKESDSISEVEIKRHNTILTSFCCNDYFGLSHNKSVKKSAINAIEKYGVGARASRYITGNHSLYTSLEKQIATMKQCDDAIVFSSGYAAAIGIIPALAGKADLIVADRLIHSSLIDGSKLSGAKIMRFAHNDIDHCQHILAENRANFKQCIIITETVFSMDGDLGNIDALLKLAKRFDALLISDDAHGLWRSTFKPNRHHIQTGTLSKSVGTLGGYVTANATMIDYLRNYAKSAIYSTALPPSILAASLTSLNIIEKKDLGQKALDNAHYFCELMNLAPPQSAIVPIIIGDNQKVVEITKKIEEKGLLISAIRPPTVEPGKARLRITFSAFHKKSQIKHLANELKNVI